MEQEQVVDGWVIERDSLEVRGGEYPDALLHLHVNGPGCHRALAMTRWQSTWAAEFLLPHLNAADPSAG